MDSSVAVFTARPRSLDEQGECPLCYAAYGRQEDDTFLCRDGIDNSDFETDCTHYICTQCAQELAKREEIRCPLCREDWTDWIHSVYYSDEEDEEDADDAGEDVYADV